MSAKPSTESELPLHHNCSACGALEADAVHPLCVCPATQSFFQLVAFDTMCPQRTDRTAFLVHLLRPMRSSEEFLKRLQYVGACFSACVASLGMEAHSSEAPSDDEEA